MTWPHCGGLERQTDLASLLHYLLFLSPAYWACVNKSIPGSVSSFTKWILEKCKYKSKAEFSVITSAEQIIVNIVSFYIDFLFQWNPAPENRHIKLSVGKKTKSHTVFTIHKSAECIGVTFPPRPYSLLFPFIKKALESR